MLLKYKIPLHKYQLNIEILLMRYVIKNFFNEIYYFLIKLDLVYLHNPIKLITIIANSNLLAFF